LFIIEVVCDNEADDDTTDPTILLHALTGIQPRASKTMQLQVQIGDATVTALLDFGSTHNFLDMAVAERIGLAPQTVTDFRVVVANGDRLACFGHYTNLDINIAGEPFSITCYGLALDSFEMVLGVQWPEALGLMLWDFYRRTLAFVCSGCRFICAADPSLAATLKAVADDVMDELLKQCSPLFTVPTGLPPECRSSHQIRLLLGTDAVVVCPYRYEYAQKEELQWQCEEMLHLGIIRPSTSAFSAPVLLVRKHDGSWRFCVDYQALSEWTIKLSFPSPWWRNSSTSSTTPPSPSWIYDPVTIKFACTPPTSRKQPSARITVCLNFSSCRSA
jgi:hypothetical protein